MGFRCNTQGVGRGVRMPQASCKAAEEGCALWVRYKREQEGSVSGGWGGCSVQVARERGSVRYIH